MAIFLFWIIGAVLVGEYASSKGLRGESFLFISLFASPLVGFLIALLSSPQQERAAKRRG